MMAMLENNNLNELKKRVSECLDIALRDFHLDELTEEKIKKELLTDKLDYYVQLLEINSTLYVVRAMKAAIRTRLDDDQTYKVLEDKVDDKTSKVDESIKKVDLEQEAGIQDKRGEIFNKWSEIIQNKANELHMDINSFLDRLIINGKEFYGGDNLHTPEYEENEEYSNEESDTELSEGRCDRLLACFRSFFGLLRHKKNPVRRLRTPHKGRDTKTLILRVQIYERAWRAVHREK